MATDIPREKSGVDEGRPELLLATLKSLLKSYPDMIFVKDRELNYVAGTESFAAMAGKESMDEIIGRTDAELFEDKELAARFNADDRKLFEEDRDLLNYLEPITDEKGKARYSITSKHILRDGDGNAMGLLGISRDVTREMQARRQYQQEINYLFNLPESAYTAILFDVDDWRIAGQRKSGDGQDVSALYNTVEHFLTVARAGLEDESCGGAREFYGGFSPEKLHSIHDSGKNSFAMEYVRSLPTGSPKWVRDELTFLQDPHTEHLSLMLVVLDIDERKRQEENISHAAITDGLTGLLNRAEAQHRIEEFLAGEGAEGAHAVFMFDVDNFKAVNDLFGHMEGDTLLTAIADCAVQCFRESDIVARFGGDEFFVLAKNMPDRAAARRKAEQLLKGIRDIRIANTAAMISISIGISMYPEDGGDMERLYASADQALYKAKKHGKNQAAFASDEQYLFSGGEAAMRYEDYNSLVVDHSSSVCYISDPETYDLLHLTRAGMEVCGIASPEEYKGKKCYEVLQGRTEPCPFCTNGKLSEGYDYRWEHYNENLDKWFDITDSLLTVNGRKCRMEIARDITGRKNNADLSSGELSMEDVLFRCLHILTTEADMDAALNLFLEGIGGYYRSNRSYIFEFDYSQGTLSNSYEWCAPGVPAEIEVLQDLPLEVVDNWIRKFKAEGEFSINSLYDEIDPDSDEFRILEMQGIKSLMAAPLISGGEIVGFIGVDDPGMNQGNLALLRSVSEFVQAELEQRKLIRELEHMSFTDALTGLKNRNQYDRVLKEYEHRTPASLGVVYVDINGTKTINDTHGHSYGDHIIRKTGRMAGESLSGTVFRTGGDEFVALVEDVSKEEFQQQVIALRSAFELERECSVSIGSAWQDSEGDMQSLLRQAGELLVADKQAYYHAVLREGRAATTNAGFASEVAREVAEGRFVVYYQPQVDIRTGRIIGAEALVRKLAEDGSLIPPNKFIPVYEAEGAISLVDQFVLRSACGQVRRWLDQGHSLHLAVNFSRITLLEPDIVETISGICREYGVPTSTITIEVTESISKMDNDQLRALIERINNAGFTISLDDFGSKYSNLAILATMDFDEIKFDRSLVETLEKNPKSRVVMENTVKMCRDLQDTKSLAEGIETKGQMELLADYECDYGQGYYFSRPLPAEEFSNMLNRED